MWSRLVALVALIVLLSFSVLFVFVKYGPKVQGPIAAQFEDKSLFLSPIKQTQSHSSGGLVTGITVPHHLLARDLIVKGFDYASNNKYDLVLLLSPDHFDLGDSDVSTTTRDFSTVFGNIQTNVEAVKSIEKLSFVHEQSFFYREHGIEAELPFVKYYFPDSKILILTLKETTPKKELDQIVDELKKILTTNSLIVQSTDFSHYLTPENADIHDQQTIKTLEENNPDQLFTLNQPSNLDSIAAQYIQSRLQKEFFGSKFKLLAHKNSQDYTKEKVSSSTSYIIQAYLKN